MPDTIPAALERAVARHGERLAIVEGDTRLTYRDLAERSHAFASAVAGAAIRPGDAVAIWAPNSAAWVTAYLGTMLAGAVLIPVNTRFRGAEATDILARSRARLLFTVTDFLDTDYVSLLGELPELDTIVVLSGPVPDRAISVAVFLAQAGSLDVETSADDASDILFTSGTTGKPKGVVQTHARTLTVASDWVAMTGLTAGDRYLMINPYFHMFGLKAGILACLVAGATMLPEESFDLDRALARVQAERVTVFPGAPTIYQSLLDHPRLADYDLSSLRVAVTGAADIPVELIRRIFAELPFTVVLSGYGLTEGGTALATDIGDDETVIATTVGRPRPGFELRLVDGQGDDVGIDQTGEILLRGRSVMSHYLDDPVATAEVLSSDGWLSTGDLGVRDADARIRIVGRSKDMFIVGGFNAYPAEIENHLLRHPGIASAAVIGIPDERLGEVGMAFVVLRPSYELSEAELIAWARQEMANYKAPRRVEFVNDLPRTATGKVQKDALRRGLERAGLSQ